MSPNSGRPLLEGSAEMTRAGGSGCLLVRGPHCRLFLSTWDLPGDQRTPWSPLQNVVLPQAQTEPACGAPGQRCCGLSGLFHLVQRDLEPGYSTPTMMEDSAPARLSSHPLLTGRGWSGLLGRPWLHTEPVLDLALSRGLVSCSHHSFLVPLFMLLK